MAAALAGSRSKKKVRSRFIFIHIFDINDLDKVNNLSKKLCKNVLALGNCKKDVDGFDSDSFQWTGVHLVPLPNQ